MRHNLRHSLKDTDVQSDTDILFVIVVDDDDDVAVVVGEGGRTSAIGFTSMITSQCLQLDTLTLISVSFLFLSITHVKIQ